MEGARDLQLYDFYEEPRPHSKANGSYSHANTHTHTSERTLGLSGTHPLACDAHRSNEWAVLFSE